jgi:NADH-quinone oxidoreductase subunit J
VNTLATRDLSLAIAVIALGATGTYLLLPHRHGSARPRRVHAAGAALAALAVVLLAAFWRPAGPALSRLFFYAFGLASVGGGILTVTSRNPIYSALWFASVVLSSSGLFLLAGAQFLAAGTVIVYAGAIIVTFLFVIMLAQSEGQAPYDRMARMPARATITCFALLGALMYALLSVQSSPNTDAQRFVPAEMRDEVAAPLVRSSRIVADLRMPPDAPLTRVMGHAVRDTARLPGPSAADGVPPPHVAGLGGTLYTDHLISVEVAGAILFVALVGALLLAAPRPPIRPGQGRDAGLMIEGRGQRTEGR